MVKIRKYANFIERFLHGENGQRFFNIAYSIGAAVVIWGALFKILHLPGGNALLCIGMGTEIAMFLLTAFDRPPKDYHWEDVFPVLDSHTPEDGPDLNGHSNGSVIVSGNYHGSQIMHGVQNSQSTSGDTMVLADGSSAPNVNIKEEDAENFVVSMKNMAEQMKGFSEQIAHLRETTDALNQVSEVLLNSYKAITDNSESVSASSNGYVERLEDLNRNIGGLNTIYEIQLKSISSQLESIDRVNRGLKDIRDMYEKSANESSRYCEETERMSRYMRQLNKIYENMITAMTMNMANPMAAAQQRTNPFDQPSKSDN